MKRIGIFAGSFDPVHEGHIQFALTALKAAKLDEVYLLPENVHRSKQGISHLAHRLAMIKIAIKNHSDLAVLDLPDRQFSVAKTLPRLNQKFADDELFMIIGSDLLDHMSDWPLIYSLLKRMILIIGLRKNTASSSPTRSEIQSKVSTLLDSRILGNDDRNQRPIVVSSPLPDLSSKSIREALLNGRTTTGLDPAVAQYISANWLYASPSNSSSAS